MRRISLLTRHKLRFISLLGRLMDEQEADPMGRFRHQQGYLLMKDILLYVLAVGGLFAGAWVWLALALHEPNGQLLTITPHNPNHLLSLYALEQLNHSPLLSHEEGQVLLTGEHQVVLSYLNSVDTTAVALGVNHRVTRMGTNASLLPTAGYSLVAGHFLRDQHLTERSAVVVLNQAAAFTLFGVIDPVGQVLTLGDDTYVVVGVIADGSEADALHLYVPATRYDSQVREVVINLALNTQHTFAYLLALLRQVGIDEDSHVILR